MVWTPLSCRYPCTAVMRARGSRLRPSILEGRFSEQCGSRSNELVLSGETCGGSDARLTPYPRSPRPTLWVSPPDLVVVVRTSTFCLPPMCPVALSGLVPFPSDWLGARSVRRAERVSMCPTARVHLPLDACNRCVRDSDFGATFSCTLVPCRAYAAVHVRTRGVHGLIRADSASRRRVTIGGLGIVADGWCGEWFFLC